MKASFSLEAVSNATCRNWRAASLDLTARRAMQEGTGSKLDWSKTLRDAFPQRRRNRPDISGEAQSALYRILLHRATIKNFLNEDG
ncbi:hypothetical protein C9I56_03500 [Paraburkholderia caribensis]|nr:hypothetical protein C9I56_03500 [Paraburkholderia caribensis]